MKSFYKLNFSLAFIILFILCNSILFSQRDSVLEYFPLHTGDFHQFIYQSGCNGDETGEYSSYHEEQVLGDTLLPTGYKYKIIISNMPNEPEEYFLRIDTVTANVYRFEDYPAPQDVLIDSLRAKIGDSFVIEGWIKTDCIGIDTLTVLGITTIVKHFRENYVFGAEYSLAFGLGRIQLLTYQDDCQYPVLDYIYRNLVYANINGRNYGTYVNAIKQSEAVPNNFILGQNYPNPFNPNTTIEFTVPQSGYVSLQIFNSLGQKIAVLISKELLPGKYKINWNAKGFSSGIYFYQLRAENYMQTKKLILLK